MSTLHVEGDLDKDLIPPAAIKAIGVLLAVVLVMAALGRLTGVGTVSTAELDGREVVMDRMIVLEGEDTDGTIRVREAGSNRLLAELPDGEGGFIRGASRPLNRERMVAGVPIEAPYRLVRWSDGALTLDDPETGVRLDLFAFGPTNAGAFAALLTADPGSTADSDRSNAPVAGGRTP